MAEAERQLPDGTEERLRVTAEEVVVTRRRGTVSETRSIPLGELADVRTRERVRRIELLVAGSYLLGAVVFLYVIVNLVERLAGPALWLVLGVLVFCAAGGVAAAWFGQEAVIQFIARDKHKRVEYHLREGERAQMQALSPLAGRLRDKH